MQGRFAGTGPRAGSGRGWPPKFVQGLPPAYPEAIEAPFQTVGRLAQRESTTLTW